MKIAVFYKKELECDSIVNRVDKMIIQHGFIKDDLNPEVVLFIGGDGTFLRAVHYYLPLIDKLKFVGINKGSLGFFSSFNEDELDTLFVSLKDSLLESQSFRLLEANCENKTVYAINEIRIENPFHTLISEVYVNDQFLETFRGNGLVISSSLGSSAYNKSLGGSVVLPNLEVMQLSEIAPINNRVYRPLLSSLIIDSNSKIRLRGDFTNVVLGYDHLIENEQKANEIEFLLSAKKITILNKKDHSFINLLNKAFIEGK